MAQFNMYVHKSDLKPHLFVHSYAHRNCSNEKYQAIRCRLQSPMKTIGDANPTLNQSNCVNRLNTAEDFLIARFTV